MAEWFEVFFAFSFFILFWSLVAWKSKGENGFFPTFLEKIGLAFFYRRTWPALLVGCIFSAAMLSLLLSMASFVTEYVILYWLIVAYFVTPFALAILFPFGKKSEPLRRVVASMTTVWSAILFVMILVLAAAIWLLSD